MFFFGKIQKEMNARCDDGDCVCQAPKISIKAQKHKDKSIKDRAAHWLSENSKHNLNIVRLNGMLKQTAIF